MTIRIDLSRQACQWLGSGSCKVPRLLQWIKDLHGDIFQHDQRCRTDLAENKYGNPFDGSIATQSLLLVTRVAQRRKIDSVD